MKWKLAALSIAVGLLFVGSNEGSGTVVKDSNECSDCARSFMGPHDGNGNFATFTEFGEECVEYESWCIECFTLTGTELIDCEAGDGETFVGYYHYSLQAEVTGPCYDVDDVHFVMCGITLQAELALAMEYVETSRAKDLARLLSRSSKLSYNQARMSLQGTGCNAATVANIPLSPIFAWELVTARVTDSNVYSWGAGSHSFLRSSQTPMPITMPLELVLLSQ